jgi:hypothetical protein
MTGGSSIQFPQESPQAAARRGEVLMDHPTPPGGERRLRAKYTARVETR